MSTERTTRQPGRADPVLEAVLAGGFLSLVSDMKSVVMRSAYSPLWREAGDLSCALVAANGDIVAQGASDIPIHLASMPLSLEGCLKQFPRETLAPGDVIIQNDPFQGNNHLPDMVMVMPLFYHSRLLAFSVVRGHWVDVGGAVAGSYVTGATDGFGEGFCIPPVKLYRQGVLDEFVPRVLAANVRNWQERAGDMRAQYAGCLTGGRRLEELIGRYGIRAVRQAMHSVVDAAEMRMRRALSSVPKGEYEFSDTCDGTGADGGAIVVRAKVVVESDRIVVDFTGSSPEVPSNRNAPLAVTVSASLFAVKAAVDPDSPANSGAYRPISVIAPLGSIVNPRPRAAVALGNHETSARIADVVLGALAQAMPTKVPAASAGSSCVVVVAGRAGALVDGEGTPIMYEVHGASQGASARGDGCDALRTGIGNTGNTPTEVLEERYPVRVVRYCLTRDASGAGEHRGGAGVTRVLYFTAPARVTLGSDRGESGPYGLRGGHSGSPGRYVVQRSDGGCEVLASNGTTFVDTGDQLVVEGPGGGGYGPPSKRATELVRADIESGIISAEYARREYGLALPADGCGGSEGSQAARGTND